MNRFLSHSSVVAVLAILGVAAFLSPMARSQMLATPSYVAVGVSSSGNTSTLWFHEPSSRQAIACQTVPTTNSGLGNIHCVTAKLP